MKRRVYIEFKSKTDVIFTTFSRQKQFDLLKDFEDGDIIDLIELHKPTQNSLQNGLDFYAKVNKYDGDIELFIYARNISSGSDCIGSAQCGEFNYLYARNGRNNYEVLVREGLFEATIK